MMQSAAFAHSSLSFPNARSRKNTIIRNVAGYVARPGSSSNGPSWDDWNDGLIEAVELYEDAESQVRRQVQVELLQALRDDAVTKEIADAPEATPHRVRATPSVGTDIIEATGVESTVSGGVDDNAKDVEATAASSQESCASDTDDQSDENLSSDGSCGTSQDTHDTNGSPGSSSTQDITREPPRGWRQYMATQVFSNLQRPWGDDPEDISSNVPDRMADGAGVQNGHRAMSDYPPSSLKALQSFLIEQGMTPLQAENTALGLEGEDSVYANTTLLGDKMERLRRLLPGVDICALVLRDRSVLTTDLTTAVTRLILINDKLGGPDLAELISRTPVLLYSQDMEERLLHTLAKLKALLPTEYPHKLLQQALIEAPTLMFRMEYYLHVDSFSELPFDIQNMFMVAGGGAGTVYRAWDGFRDNNND